MKHILTIKNYLYKPNLTNWIRIALLLLLLLAMFGNGSYNYYVFLRANIFILLVTLLIREYRPYSTSYSAFLLCLTIIFNPFTFARITLTMPQWIFYDCVGIAVVGLPYWKLLFNKPLLSNHKPRTINRILKYHSKDSFYTYLMQYGNEAVLDLIHSKISPYIKSILKIEAIDDARVDLEVDIMCCSVLLHDLAADILEEDEIIEGFKEAIYKHMIQRIAEIYDEPIKLSLLLNSIRNFEMFLSRKTAVYKDYITKSKSADFCKELEIIELMLKNPMQDHTFLKARSIINEYHFDAPFQKNIVIAIDKLHGYSISMLYYSLDIEAIQSIHKQKEPRF